MSLTEKQYNTKYYCMEIISIFKFYGMEMIF